MSLTRLFALGRVVPRFHRTGRYPDSRVAPALALIQPASRMRSLVTGSKSHNTPPSFARPITEPAAGSPATRGAPFAGPPPGGPAPPEVPNSTAPSSPPPPPNPKIKKGIVRRTLKLSGWAAAGVLAVGAYELYRARNPPEQLPYDPTKRTIVVLGSGWASTSFLKKLKTDQFNVVVISPHNYFLFTPLLPSVPTGTVQGRSIAQPTRMITRYLPRHTQVIEAEAEKVDLANQTVTFEDHAVADHVKRTIKYDYLLYGVGSEIQTFGIQGVKDHGCTLKELPDAEKIRNKLMDAFDAASIVGTPEEDVQRLLHMVVVGGGPTGVEYAAELRDFAASDLKKWYPEIAGKVRVTLLEALPSILPAFNQRLIEYTNETFKEEDIELKTKHVVKDVDARAVYAQGPDGNLERIPYGVLVWTAGNTLRPLTKDIIDQLPNEQHGKKGLEVDSHLRLKGAEQTVFAAGDASLGYAPTAQVASQQGAYLAHVINRMGAVASLHDKKAALEALPLTEKSRSEILHLQKKIHKVDHIKPFEFTNRGAMAMIGHNKAIADLPTWSGSDIAASGFGTFLFWKSAYWSMLFGLRQRMLVAWDWTSVSLFGRDVTRE